MLIHSRSQSWIPSLAHGRPSTQRWLRTRARPISRPRPVPADVDSISSPQLPTKVKTIEESVGWKPQKTSNPQNDTVLVAKPPPLKPVAESLAPQPLAPQPGAQPRSEYLEDKSRPRKHLDFTSHHVSKHWETVPPTDEQLAAANKYFEAVPPRFLWSAPKFATMKFGDSPEVCFLGRSNVGKSSLLNSILGKKELAHVSAKPGRTKMMNAFAVTGNLEQSTTKRLVVLDMPGYGHGGQADWGKEILKYLSQRKQMKRAFLLVNAEHGLKKSDEQLLALFRKHNISHQVLLSKADQVLFLKNTKNISAPALNKRFHTLYKLMDEVKAKVSADLEDEGSGLGEVIACSSVPSPLIKGKLLGIDAVRFAMLRAAGLEYKPKTQPAKAVDIVSYDDLQKMVPNPTGRAASAAPVEKLTAKTQAKKYSADDVVSWKDLNM